VNLHVFSVRLYILSGPGHLHGTKEDTEIVSQSQESSRYPTAARTTTTTTDVFETTKPAKPLASPRSKGLKQVGNPCTSRAPLEGDFVISTGGKRTGHDVKGTAKAWISMPWQVAKVVQVDADGDFRLLNEQGVESGFMFRREFAFLAELGVQASPIKDQATKSLSRDSSAVRDRTFEVKLKCKDGAKLGLALDSSDVNAFEVLAVDGGMALAYNQQAAQVVKLCFGDFIVGVNGQQGDKAAMLKELEKPIVVLSVAPRVKFTAVIIKEAGEEPGVSCAYEAVSSTLLVQQVHGNMVSSGYVYKYNKSAAAGNTIEQGDRITEVNGIRTRPKEMLEEMTKSGKLELVIGRPKV